MKYYQELIDLKNCNGKTAAHLAMQSDEPSKTIIKTLADHGADFTLQNRDQQSPIDLAIEGKHYSLLVLMLIHTLPEQCPELLLKIRPSQYKVKLEKYYRDLIKEYPELSKKENLFTKMFNKGIALLANKPALESVPPVITDKPGGIKRKR